MKRIEMIPYPVGRVFNEPWSPTDECPRCHDIGLVAVKTDHWGDDMGPCPDCRRGFCVEFGYGRTQSKHGPVCVQSEWPQWGPQGYWAKQGALIGMLPITRDSDPLPRPENERRMIVLGKAMIGGGFTPELLEELFAGDHEGLAEHNRLAGAHVAKSTGGSRAAPAQGARRELPRF